MSYVIELDRLKLGDIILSAEEKPVSKGIRYATSGEFSHAMLYVGNSVIHATTGGVFSKNPQRVLAKEKKHLKVLRLIREPSIEKATYICDFARDKVGTLYSKIEAMRTISKSIPTVAKTNKQFCSRLVAQSYASVDIKLVSNYDYCSPEQLNTSLMLYEVGDSVRKATSKEIGFAKSKDPVLKHQKETYKWLNKARSLAGKINYEIVTENDVLQFLLKNPVFDKMITKQVRETKYLDFYNYDKKANPHRYDFDDFRRVLPKESNQIEVVLGKEVNKEISLVSRFSKMLYEFKAYQTAGLDYVNLHIALYTQLLQVSLERLIVLRDIQAYTNMDELYPTTIKLILAVASALNSQEK
jgi:hypothetical protein